MSWVEGCNCFLFWKALDRRGIYNVVFCRSTWINSDELEHTKTGIVKSHLIKVRKNHCSSQAIIPHYICRLIGFNDVSMQQTSRQCFISVYILNWTEPLSAFLFSHPLPWFFLEMDRSSLGASFPSRFGGPLSCNLVVVEACWFRERTCIPSAALSSSI